MLHRGFELQEIHVGIGVESFDFIDVDVIEIRVVRSVGIAVRVALDSDAGWSPSVMIAELVKLIQLWRNPSNGVFAKDLLGIRLLMLRGEHGKQRNGNFTVKYPNDRVGSSMIMNR